MKKLAVCLCLLSLVMVSPYVYAGQPGLQADAMPAVSLVTGDEPFAFDNDIGLTSFTMDTYLNGVLVERKIVVITGYIDLGHVFRPVRMTIRVIVYEGGEGNPIEVQEIREGGTEYIPLMGRLVIPREQSPLPENSKTILVLFPTVILTGPGEEIRISNVIVSDLVTEEQIAVLPVVNIGGGNELILEKLESIHQDVKTIDYKTSTNSGLLRSIYKIVRSLPKQIFRHWRIKQRRALRK